MVGGGKGRERGCDRPQCYLAPDQGICDMVFINTILIYFYEMTKGRFRSPFTKYAQLYTLCTCSPLKNKHLPWIS